MPSRIGSVIPFLALAFAMAALFAALSPDEAEGDLADRVNQTSVLSERLDRRIKALESEEGPDLEAEMASVRSSLEELSGQIGDLQAGFSKAEASDAERRRSVEELSRKLDALNAKVSALEKDLKLLTTRFNDHLAKPH